MCPTRSQTAFLNLRYEGTDFGIMTSSPDELDFEAPFLAQYQREFGFTLGTRRIFVDDIRVRARGLAAVAHDHHVTQGRSGGAEPQPAATHDVYFEGGRLATNIYHVKGLTSRFSFDSFVC